MTGVLAGLVVVVLSLLSIGILTRRIEHRLALVLGIVALTAPAAFAQGMGTWAMREAARWTEHLAEVIEEVCRHGTTTPRFSWTDVDHSTSTSETGRRHMRLDTRVPGQRVLGRTMTDWHGRQVTSVLTRSRR